MISTRLFRRFFAVMPVPPSELTYPFSVKSIPDHESELRALVEQRQYDKAEARFEEICSIQEANIASFNVILSMNRDLNRYDEGARVFKKMLACGVAPNVQACNLMIALANKNYKRKIAEKIFIEMVAYDVKPDVTTYNLMLGMFGKEKDSKPADELFLAMRRSSVVPDIVTYNTMLALYIKLKLHKEALCLFGEMRQIEDLKIDRITYATVIHMLASTKRIVKAEQMFEEMLADGHHPNVVIMNTLILMYIKMDNSKRMKETFARMQNLEVLPNVVTFNALLGYCKKTRNYNEASYYFRLMRKYRVLPNKPTFTLLMAIYKREKMAKQMATIERLQAAAGWEVIYSKHLPSERPVKLSSPKAVGLERMKILEKN